MAKRISEKIGAKIYFKRDELNHTGAHKINNCVGQVLLALRIEQLLEKDKILELYLNQIYLGYRSYGVAAASLNYFNKSLNELTISEAAYLAALPKAPNNYHPIKKYKASSF